MSLHAPGPCARCGRNPATGYAQIGDDWLCHGDDDPDPTCYMREQPSGYVVIDLDEIPFVETDK